MDLNDHIINVQVCFAKMQNYKEANKKHIFDPESLLYNILSVIT